jgi:clan AA aspartic protease
MIEGYVNEALEPIVQIGLKQGGPVTTIPAVVDTGFSGGLCLSEKYVDNIAMTFEYTEPYELANGEVIFKDVFRGSVVFDGREQEVDLIFTSSPDSLIGASLLESSALSINYPERTVRIDKGDS